MWYNLVMKIGLIPIDNRPVCYTLPKLIAQIDKNLELLVPDRSLLGSLEKYAQTDALFNWLEEVEAEALVISLDTIAYGGLISSRRCPQTLVEILERLRKLKKLLKNKKVYAFSSIMRISNNNINVEEKEYWSEYGKKIFQYSYDLHKNGTVQTDIPDEILADYLETRKRNFEVNKVYLEWQKEGIFETLIFSKDDCAQFGLNVKEAEELQKMGANIKTGADEIPLTLLARAIGGNYSVAPIFTEPKTKNLISNYEDISIENCVKNQLELANFTIKPSQESDIDLFVNNFIEKQGEIVMKIPTEPYSGIWQKPQKPYAIADVRFANGADNAFIDKLFVEDFDENFLGYSAWNTSANSLGSLLFALKTILNAKSKNSFNQDAFNKLILTRFLDDWAYQANIRQSLTTTSVQELHEKMKNFEKLLLAKFPQSSKISYSFPWNRLFEVEIEFS